MQIKLKSKVDAQGKLFLQLPQQLANQELVIIITDSSEEKISTPEELGYPADFFDKTAGKWAGEVLKIDFPRVPLTSNFKLTAYNGNLYRQQTFTGINGLVSLGNFQLCDSANTQNNFQLSAVSSLIGNVSASYNVYQCEVNQSASGDFISIAQLDTAYQGVLSFGFAIPSYSQGTYAWGANCNITGTALINGQSYNMVTNSSVSGGQTVITSAPGVGGYVEVSFTGPVTASSSSNPSITFPATITGHYIVYRSL